MRALIFDPFAGVAGDMTIAGLLDLGLPLEWLRSFVAELDLGQIRVDAERVDRLGIACTRLILELPEEHAHRHLSDVLRIIEGVGVEPSIRDRAAYVFTLLAEAEAKVHGTSVDAVHFHEVGALDAIVDVLGSVAGCRELGFERFYTRPVALGRGWAKMAHGNFPVPPPAVLNLLRGTAVTDPPFEGECTTPTGAALIAGLTGGEPPPVGFTPEETGFGAGSRNPGDRPNCLRLVAMGGLEDGTSVRVIQADIDDMPAEFVPPLLEDLLSAGAEDATVTPTLMKKGRPGFRVDALAGPSAVERVRAAMFRSSTTIGIREWTAERTVLERREEIVKWRGHTVRVKRSSLPGGGDRAKPEFADVLTVADVLGMSPLSVYRAMLADGIAAPCES